MLYEVITVSAAKLRRAQEAAEAARPYAERMNRMMQNLAAGVEPSAEAPRLMTGTGKDQVHLIVLFSALKAAPRSVVPAVGFQMIPNFGFNWS